MGCDPLNLMKLLIVDDNSEMRRLIINILGNLATSVNECGDGDEAVAAYAKCSPDWVLMDVKMPKVDGITATRQIKTAFPTARVMIVTDYDNRNLREAALTAGAEHYVLKEDLLLMRRILQEHPTN